MSSVEPLTNTASVGRAAPEEVERQAQRLLAISPLLREVLDGVPDPVMVLNSSRQIILANRTLRTMMGDDGAGYRGLRPGEALGCNHPVESLAGCGTTDFAVSAARPWRSWPVSLAGSLPNRNAGSGAALTAMRLTCACRLRRWTAARRRLPFSC